METSSVDQKPVLTYNNDDDIGVPGLFKPQVWDIEDEFKLNPAYRDYQRFIINNNNNDE